jgi:hypothetical protein
VAKALWVTFFCSIFSATVTVYPISVAIPQAGGGSSYEESDGGERGQYAGIMHTLAQRPVVAYLLQRIRLSADETRIFLMMGMKDQFVTKEDGRRVRAHPNSWFKKRRADMSTSTSGAR